MVALWASAATLKLDSTAVAFLGLGVLLVSGVLTLEDIAKEGDVLATFIWFAGALHAQRSAERARIHGLSRPASRRFAQRTLAAPLPGLALVVAYVLLHYVFVSQTAHLLALFGVFLDVGIRLGVPAAPLAFQLLFATNYFAAITPQGIEREPPVRRQRPGAAGGSATGSEG